MSQHPTQTNLEELNEKGYLDPDPPPLRGFDPQYKDIVDYIVRITQSHLGRGRHGLHL